MLDTETRVSVLLTSAVLSSCILIGQEDFLYICNFSNGYQFYDAMAGAISRLGKTDHRIEQSVKRSVRDGYRYRQKEESTDHW